MTIKECTNQILQSLNGSANGSSVDGFKFGDPERELTGVATTFMPSCEVIRKADEAGANLIITHEPTFYSDKEQPEEDAVFAAKRELIEKTQCAIWRFHDRLHAHTPDAIQVGLIRKLGYEYLPDPQHLHICRIPSTTLGKLCDRLKTSLGARNLRWIGSEGMRCEKIGLYPGAAGTKRTSQIDALWNENADVVICGETSAVSAADYILDARENGEEKGIIILGHCHSEEPGMEYLAEWIRVILPETATFFIPAGDPFRSL